jgi:hypothetical protein
MDSDSESSGMPSNDEEISQEPVEDFPQDDDQEEIEDEDLPEEYDEVETNIKGDVRDDIQALLNKEDLGIVQMRIKENLAVSPV